MNNGRGLKPKTEQRKLAYKLKIETAYQMRIRSSFVRASSFSCGFIDRSFAAQFRPPTNC